MHGEDAWNQHKLGLRDLHRRATFTAAATTLRRIAASSQENLLVPSRIRRLRHALRFILVSATPCFALASCSGSDQSPLSLDGNGSTIKDSKVPKASTADAVLLLRTPSAEYGERGGTTLQLDVVLVNKHGKEKYKDKKMTWSSTNTAIATVDSTGLVTAQDTGSVMIVVDYKDAADSVAVEVIPVPVVSIVLAGPDSLSLEDTVSVVATARDSVGEPLIGRVFEWLSSTFAVASVSSTGSVIALTVGSSDISATIGSVSASRTIRVWPQPAASVEVSPSVVSVPQFHKVRYTAIVRDRRGKALGDRPVVWSSSDATIFYIKANADTAAAKDLGTAVVRATAEGVSGTSAVTVINPVEARALWVTRFEYTGPGSVDFAKIATIMAKAASANFNVVYFQARTSGDALYFSSLEPCSPRMCGVLGGPRPAQDPLDVALREAAKYGIQVHAWLNAYTGFISGSTTACNQFINSSPANWLKANPHWSVSTKNFTTGVLTRQVDNCATSSEYMWVSPGVPEVRAQLARISADVARRYGPKGLKGIHLDRIRYPSNQVSYDAATQEAFRTATGAYPASNAQASWLDFRRGLVNQGVKAVFDSVRAVNSALVLSAAVFPAYQPRAGWSALWSYSDLFQDPSAWALGGYLDVEVAMNYPATAASLSWTVKAYCSNTDWTCVMDEHINRIERTAGRHVYVGVGAIKGWTEVQKQLTLAHDRSVSGVSVYSFSQVDAIPGGWSLLAAGPFKNRATVPEMPWRP